MIIEINYLTVALLAAVVSAVGGVLWAMGRSLLQQYGDMLRDQLAAHRTDVQRGQQSVLERLEAIDRELEDHAARITRLDVLVEKAPTHADLDKLYSRVNTTAEDVAEIKGTLKVIGESLRALMNRVAERGLP
ncbi:hypothetical protein [Pseudothauera rhizosphaerae]|uniref:DUF2730 family protein n=1 Tax=Pseudothauera rhizosphaerae TaxID=2565932 RepID=A0A4S4AMT4_9RHOO|nr:hypothetical protein [Pseudothauera rhizosphaerae]THF60921.1 hypothetical protein E6O51_11875 [Pseudothauera rhizosphaerae]